MVLEAQRRRDNNDTVHIYEEGDAHPLCSDYQPRRNRSEPVYTVKEEEVRKEEYLSVDGQIIGRICGRCRNSLTGKVGSNA
jgi:hypothetical protein